MSHIFREETFRTLCEESQGQVRLKIHLSDNMHSLYKFIFVLPPDASF